jgi:hypothetical protein
MLSMKFSLVVLVCLGSSWGVQGEEEAMSAVDLTEDNFKDKVCNYFSFTIFQCVFVRSTHPIEKKYCFHPKK